MSFFFGPAMLAFEAQQVIALRMAKCAFGGPDAMFEVGRMVNEKLEASANVAGMMSRAMMKGTFDGGAAEVVTMLRREVRANKRRLTK